jgi:signal recognition particle subunit SRP9
MGYIRDWSEFLARSEALFRKSPSKTRYNVKYRHCAGKLILKVTDDREVGPLHCQRPLWAP